MSVLENVTVDGRAHLRDKFLPEGVTAVRVSSFRDALQAVSLVREFPVLIIKENGSAVLMSSGGSGQIWVCTNEEPNDAQMALIDKTRSVFASLGAPIILSDRLFELS